MIAQRQVNIFSRVLSCLLLILGGSFWLTSWWYVKFRMGEEMLALPVVVLLFLHIIGALAGIRASVSGILFMIIFTALSLIAPIYLNVPFRPGNMIWFLYIVLISMQLVLLIIYLTKRRAFKTNG